MAGPGQIDFAVNVHPDPPPTWLREAMTAALDRAAAYPDDTAAVHAIAQRHGRSRAEVLPVNGSADAMWTLAAAVRPRRAVVVHPSFTEPEAALRALGHPVDRVFRDEDSFALDVSRVPEDADLVVVCNPNNPTGTLDDAESILALARPGRTLVVDEAFMDFVPGERDSLTRTRGVVVMRSATKIWSVPGIRAGYVLADAALVERLRSFRQPWPVNAVALEVLRACAEQDATPRAADIASWREELAADLRGVRVWRGAANFLLLRAPPGLRERLGASGIAVRRADTFPGLSPEHIRVAVRRPQDNAKLAGAVSQLALSTPPARST